MSLADYTKRRKEKAAAESGEDKGSALQLMDTKELGSVNSSNDEEAPRGGLAKAHTGTGSSHHTAVHDRSPETSQPSVKRAREDPRDAHTGPQKLATPTLRESDAQSSARKRVARGLDGAARINARRNKTDSRRPERQASLQDKEDVLDLIRRVSQEMDNTGSFPAAQGRKRYIGYQLAALKRQKDVLTRITATEYKWANPKVCDLVTFKVAEPFTFKTPVPVELKYTTRRLNEASFIPHLKGLFDFQTHGGLSDCIRLLEWQQLDLGTSPLHSQWSARYGWEISAYLKDVMSPTGRLERQLEALPPPPPPPSPPQPSTASAANKTASAFADGSSPPPQAGAETLNREMTSEHEPPSPLSSYSPRAVGKSDSESDDELDALIDKLYEDWGSPVDSAGPDGNDGGESPEDGEETAEGGMKLAKVDEGKKVVEVPTGAGNEAVGDSEDVNGTTKSASPKDGRTVRLDGSSKTKASRQATANGDTGFGQGADDDVLEDGEIVED